MGKRILVAVVLAPLFFVVLFFLDPVWLAVLMAAISALASFELLRATGVAHHNGMYFCTALAAAAIPLGDWLGQEGMVLQASALVLMVAIFWIAIRLYDREQAVRFEDVLVCLFGGLMIPWALSALVELKGMEQGRFLVLLPVICAFLTDGGAYFAGIFLGRHRGITRVSPNKSLEGYIGGILSGAIFLLIYGVLLERFAGLDAVPAGAGRLRPGGQRGHRAGRPVLLLCEAAVRREGLRRSPARPRGDAGPVRLHGVRRPHPDASGGAVSPLLTYFLWKRK